MHVLYSPFSIFALHSITNKLLFTHQIYIEIRLNSSNNHIMIFFRLPRQRECGKKKETNVAKFDAQNYIHRN